MDDLPEHLSFLEKELISTHRNKLYYDDNKLVYEGDSGGIFFDWVSQWQYHQKQNYAFSKEPLYKALGLKKGVESQVWDVSCGTGKDSLLMLSFGAKIMAFERHPVVAALIADAHFLAKKEISTLSTHFSFCYGDVRNVHSLVPPDVIFYDPMYPEKKKKSALPRKEMQIFQSLVGGDADESEFLEWALETATKRVVVKRGLRSPEIEGKQPSFSYKGKSTRYDMYMT